MPNGKGSPEWGWTPSFEEILVALVVFVLTLILSRSLILASLMGFAAGLVLLWMNNGYPWFRK